MKKILLVTHSYPNKNHPSKGIFIKDEVSLMKDEVHFNITVAKTLLSKWVEQNRYESDVELSEISYFSLPISSYKIEKGHKIYRALVSKIQGYRPDIIHAHHLVPSGLALGYVNIPSVITIHGSDWNVYSKKEKWLPEIERAFDRTSKIITVSSALRDDILSKFPDISQKIVSIPHTVDEFWFTPPMELVSKKTDIVRIVVVASLIPVKGVIHLIEALTLLKNEKKIRIDIFSISEDIEYKKKIDKILPEIDNSITINFRKESPRETIKEYYHVADFSILPSINEGFGLSILEANACGLPVLATKSGGPETIISNVNGLIVEPGNSKELARSIELMVATLDSFKPNQIKEFVKTHYHPEKRKDAILSVYESIVPSATDPVPPTA